MQKFIVKIQNNSIILTNSIRLECARDLAAYMKTGLIGKLFNCDSNGNYKTTTAAPAMATNSATGSVLTGNVGMTGLNTVTGPFENNTVL